MSIFHAILLGIIQGLTEFLPISSSAHLTLAGNLLGLINNETSRSWTAFMAVIQLGTLAAVVIYFYKDIVLMVSSLWDDLRNYGLGGFKSYSFHSMLAIYIVFGTLPIAIIGLAFKDIIEGMLTKSTFVIASSLIGLALLLWFAERIATHKRTLENLNLKDSLLIGFGQTMALIPGSSRSGTTLTAGLFLNLTREAAAKFSFLLSIPAVAGSGFLELRHVHEGIGAFGIPNAIIATFVSGIVGYAAIAWLLRFLSTNTTFVFIAYRIGLGLLLLFLLFTGVLKF